MDTIFGVSAIFFSFLILLPLSIYILVLALSPKKTEKDKKKLKYISIIYLLYLFVMGFVRDDIDFKLWLALWLVFIAVAIIRLIKRKIKV